MTLAEQGVKQVDVTGLDDKREMTALLACTLAHCCLLSSFMQGKQPNVVLWWIFQKAGIFGIQTVIGALKNYASLYRSSYCSIC